MTTTVDDALAGIVEAAVTRAVSPLVAELHALRAELGAVRAAAGAGRWLSRADAAKELAVCLDTVDRRIADGSLQSRRLGRAVRVLVGLEGTP